MFTNRVSRRAGGLLAAFTALTLAAACGSNGGGAGDSTTYLVGFSAIQSGPAAFAGVPIVRGAQLAVKEINDSGYLGSGAKIKLDVKDGKGDPAQAISIYRQYVADEASGVLCCGLSSEAGAIAPLIKQNNVPAIVTSAILEGLAAPPYVFRPVILPNAKGGLYDQFVDKVVAAEKYRTAVVVITADNDGMVADSEVWKSALDRNGVRVLKTVKTNAADTNFTGPATEIAAAAPDVVVSSQLGTPSALLAKSLRERGYDKRILTSYGVDSQELFKSSAGGLAGTVFFAPFHAGFGGAKADQFAKAYQAAYGSAPDMFGAQGYTAMWLLAQGIKEGGGKDPKDVAAGLSKVTAQDTVYGPVTYQGGQASMTNPPVYLEWQKDGTLKEWTG